MNNEPFSSILNNRTFWFMKNESLIHVNHECRPINPMNHICMNDRTPWTKNLRDNVALHACIYWLFNFQQVIGYSRHDDWSWIMTNVILHSWNFHTESMSLGDAGLIIPVTSSVVQFHTIFIFSLEVVGLISPPVEVIRLRWLKRIKWWKTSKYNRQVPKRNLLSKSVEIFLWIYAPCLLPPHEIPSQIPSNQSQIANGPCSDDL